MLKNCLIILLLTAVNSNEVSELEESDSVLIRREKEESEDCRCLTGKPSSCAELILQGHTRSGVYTIYPRPWFRQGPFKVYCDMKTDGGGWTVFQRRDDFDSKENFYRGWYDYRRGFGNLSREFWLGNDYLHVLSQQDRVTLRIDLEDFDGYKRHATYSKFEVSNWTDKFRLTVDLTVYTGDAGNSLINQNINYTTYPFVTHDQDNSPGCAKMYKGGWWYTSCHSSNLNGLYLRGHHESYADGIEWSSWKGTHYSLKFTEMKVRPTYFIHCAED